MSDVVVSPVENTIIVTVSPDKGNTQVTLYKVADTIPATPTGNVPSGWSAVPLTGINWASVGVRTAGGVLVGTWSTPVRWTGVEATIAAGTATSLSVGATPTVTNTGTPTAAVLDFGIPTGATGAQGPSGTLAVGTVTVLDAGATPTVVNAGTAQAAVLNFGIPNVAGHTQAMSTISDAGATGKAVLATATPAAARVALETNKLTTMPDGATAVYAQDFVSGIDSLVSLSNITSPVVNSGDGSVRLTAVSGASSMYLDRTGTFGAVSGKYGVIRCKASAACSLYIVDSTGLVSYLVGTVGTTFSCFLFPIPVLIGNLAFRFGPTNAYVDIDYIWLGAYDYLVNSISTAALRIANQLGDSSGVGIAATGTITSNGTAPSDGDTVTIAGKVYTYKATLGTTEGQVLIGASASAALDNLKLAINSTGPTEFQYCAAINPLVEATTNTDTVQTLVARATGELGNQITIAKSASTLTLGNATVTTNATALAGGVSDVAAKITSLARNATTGAKTAGYFPKYATVGGAVAIAADAISFPATQAASTDPNALDDYEEGDWTPTMIGSTTAGTQTYSTAAGSYVKIGRMVLLFFQVSITAKDVTMAGDLRIGGIPVTITTTATSTFRTGGAIAYMSGVTLSSGKTSASLRMTASRTSIDIYQHGSGVVSSLLTVTDIADSSTLSGQITYTV